jgi:hypothetical protein
MRVCLCSITSSRLNDSSSTLIASFHSSASGRVKASSGVSLEQANSSWTQTVTRASGGGELCLVVVALQSAEGFGVQRVEVLETGGEPALAEWLGLWATGSGTAITALERRRRAAPDGYRRLLRRR